MTRRYHRSRRPVRVGAVTFPEGGYHPLMSRTVRLMRPVVRTAIVLSAIAVLVAILVVASADSALDEAYPGGEDDDFWTLAGVAALMAGGALAFIWLGVFVIYVLIRAVRAARDAP
jgi:preprotein translocase subunit SecG